MKSPHRPRSRILETLWPQERVAHLRGRSERVKARLSSIPACMLVLRTIRELSNDDATHMAAGVAFYAILSLFPMTLGLVALLSVFLDSSSVQTQLLAFFQDYLPGVNDALDTNINAGSSIGGFLGVLSFLGLFWSASAVFGAISRAVNRAWDVHQDRSFVVAKLRHIAMALGVGLLFLLSVGATTSIQFLNRVDLPGSPALGSSKTTASTSLPEPCLSSSPSPFSFSSTNLSRILPLTGGTSGPEYCWPPLPSRPANPCSCFTWTTLPTMGEFTVPWVRLLPCWCGHTCLP